MKWTIIFLLSVMLVLIILIHHVKHGEHYIANFDKAQSITNWFHSNKRPRYNKYKHDMPDSDIVDYEKVRNLIQQNGLDQLTPTKVLSTINST